MLPLFYSMQQDFDTVNKMRSLYIYNFTKYIDWPAAYKEGSFIIGLVGDSPMFDELVKLSKDKKAVNQTIEIKKFSDPGSITKCHILVIPREAVEKINVNDAITKAKNYSTLVVTEKDGMAKQGAGINFVVVDNKLKFELNKGRVEN
jgi:hypothetical protein